MRLATSAFAMFISVSFSAECAAEQLSPISSDGSANTIVERVIESKSSADAVNKGVESQSPAAAVSVQTPREAPATADANSPAAVTLAPVAAPAPVAPTTAAPAVQAAAPATIAAPGNRAVRVARKAESAHKAFWRAPRAHVRSASRGTVARPATPPHFAEQPRTEIVSVEPAVRRCNNLACPKFVLLGVAY